MSVNHVPWSGPFGHGAAKVGLESFTDDANQALPQKFYQLWLHEFEGIGTIQTDQTLSLE